MEALLAAEVDKLITGRLRLPSYDTWRKRRQRNATALQAKYPGLSVNGIFSGKLDNAGETIRLSTPNFSARHSVHILAAPPS